MKQTLPVHAATTYKHNFNLADNHLPGEYYIGRTLRLISIIISYKNPLNIFT